MGPARLGCVRPQPMTASVGLYHIAVVKESLVCLAIHENWLGGAPTGQRLPVHAASSRRCSLRPRPRPCSRVRSLSPAGLSGPSQVLGLRHLLQVCSTSTRRPSRLASFPWTPVAPSPITRRASGHLLSDPTPGVHSRTTPATASALCRPFPRRPPAPRQHPHTHVRLLPSSPSPAWTPSRTHCFAVLFPTLRPVIPR